MLSTPGWFARKKWSSAAKPAGARPQMPAEVASWTRPAIAPENVRSVPVAAAGVGDAVATGAAVGGCGLGIAVAAGGDAPPAAAAAAGLELALPGEPPLQAAAARTTPASARTRVVRPPVTRRPPPCG